MPQVLLIESNPSVRAALRGFLERESYTVVDIPDGAAALDALRERIWPQVVLVGQLSTAFHLAALLRAAKDSLDLRRHTFVVMEGARPDLSEDLLAEVRDDLEVLIVDRPRADSDAFERCKFLETLDEAGRCAAAF